jgi:hypothetical protein
MLHPCSALTSQQGIPVNGLLQGCTVEAHLYKVLVYGPGGHFVPHRDTGEGGSSRVFVAGAVEG